MDHWCWILLVSIDQADVNNQVDIILLHNTWLAGASLRHQFRQMESELKSAFSLLLSTTIIMVGVGFSEPDFAFLNRIKNSEFQKIRIKLEEWFTRYPDHSKNDLKSRFRKDFKGAFFELFTYQFFCKLGFEDTNHPEIFLSGKTPDFLFGSKTLSFYLEATVVRDISEDEQKRENILNVIYDAINTIDLPNFYLDLSDFELKSQGSPSTTRLRSFLERESLNYDCRYLHQTSGIFYNGRRP